MLSFPKEVILAAANAGVILPAFIRRPTRVVLNIYTNCYRESLMRSVICLVACLISGFLLSGQSAAAGTPDIDKVCKDAGYQRVELTERDGQFYCDCNLKGTKLTMMIDTGMPHCSIDKAVPEKHGVKMLDSIKLLAVGGTIVGNFVAIDSIKIGKFDTMYISNTFNAVAVDGMRKKSGYDGWIGLEAIQMMGAIIDYHNRVMYVRRPITAAWPKLSGSWTATSWKEDGVARAVATTSPPMFDFADEMLTITDGKSTRQLAFDYFLDPAYDLIWLYDPKNMGKSSRKHQAVGIVKVSGETMTVCLRFGEFDYDKLPMEFKSEKGSGHTLIELKQPGKKRSPPDPVNAALVKAGFSAVPLRSEADGHIIVDGKLGKLDWPMMLDTGAGSTVVDEARVKKLGAMSDTQEKVYGAGGEIVAPLYTFRGLSIGTYDIRRSWGFLQASGLDLDWMNKARAQEKLPEIKGILGSPELLNGSAVIDLGTNTLYLRPVKVSLQPKLAGTWVLKASTAEGIRTAAADDKQTMTVTADRIAFKGGAKDTEHGYHVKDDWSLYRLAMFDPKKDDLADGFEYTDSDGGGYFKVDGDTLKLVRIVDVTKLTAPPNEFKAPKNSGLMLLDYVRKK